MKKLRTSKYAVPRLTLADATTSRQRDPAPIYILESAKEFYRLEQQSRVTAYRFETEENLFRKEVQKRLNSKSNSSTELKILDAGCGSGSYFARLAREFSMFQFEGWDQAEDRIRQASRLYATTHQNLTFHRINILNIEKNDPRFKSDTRFDAIFCRFVLQHLQPPVQKNWIRALRQRINPGSPIMVVDLDSVLGHFHTEDSRLLRQMKTLEEKLPIDLHAGKRMPQLLWEAGATSVELTIEPLILQGKEIRAESVRMQARLEHAFPTLKATLSSEREANDFIDRYIRFLKFECRCLYFTKLIAVARFTKKGIERS